MASIDRVLEIFDWCARARENPEPTNWFSDDFVFDNGEEVHDRTSFIQRRNTSSGLADIKVLHAVQSEDVVAALFVCVDGVSRLEMRAGWFVRFQGECVVRITSVHSFSSWPPQVRGG